MVYVLNSIGKPLMPCSNSKARKLLRAGKAKIVRRDIFTIQLLYRSNNYRQETTLGIDAGSKHIGFSVTTEKLELISGTAELRTNVVKLLSSRNILKHRRRQRKTRYRKPRFNNRISNKKPHWTPPSILQKINSHIRLSLLFKSVLPIDNIIVEVAAFDILKIKDPSIRGLQYQLGEQLGFSNIREYILYRDSHTCLHCMGKSKDIVLQVHHIESRATGGDSPGNLITLCKTCHKAYHDGKIKLKIKRNRPFRCEVEMGLMRLKIVDGIKKYFSNVKCTYGYITKCNRIMLSLPKEHYNDAFCITKNLKAKKLKNHYIIKFVARHNRILHILRPARGGNRWSMNAPYWIKNTKFTRYDKVLFNNEEYFISGNAHGAAILRNFNNNINDNFKPSITTRKLKFITHRHGSMVIL